MGKSRVETLIKRYENMSLQELERVLPEISVSFLRPAEKAKLYDVVNTMRSQKLVALRNSAVESSEIEES